MKKDKILADVMKSDELITKTLWPSRVKTYHINVRELEQILNTQESEGRCKKCKHYDGGTWCNLRHATLEHIFCCSDWLDRKEV